MRGGWYLKAAGVRLYMVPSVAHMTEQFLGTFLMIVCNGYSLRIWLILNIRCMYNISYIKRGGNEMTIKQPFSPYAGIFRSL